MVVHSEVLYSGWHGFIIGCEFNKDHCRHDNLHILDRSSISTVLTLRTNHPPPLLFVEMQPPQNAYVHVVGREPNQHSMGHVFVFSEVTNRKYIDPSMSVVYSSCADPQDSPSGTDRTNRGWTRNPNSRNRSRVSCSPSTDYLPTPTL